MLSIKFEADVISDAGNVKQVNEDSGLVLHYQNMANNALLVVVADGVGGMGHGEVSSHMLTQALGAWWEAIDWGSQPELDTLFRGLETRIQQINEQVLAYNFANSIHSSTTATALLLSGTGYRIFHVGDSRVYRLKPGLWVNAELLTQDHTKILPKEIKGKVILKPYLTDCIGHKAVFASQLVAGTCQAGDAFLVCSDGIYKTVAVKEIAKIMGRRKKPVTKICGELVALAKNNGEKDNLTAAVVRIIK